MKNKRGITLIALVITIIVLLILVGVTLNLLGEDGIIAKAKWSAYVTEYEVVNEQKEMYAAVHKYDKYSVIGLAKTASIKIAMYPVSR